MISKEDAINNEYFEWLSNLVCINKFANEVSFRKLLMDLHGTIFRYSIPKDENRASDGLDLRYRFLLERELDDDYIHGPCSVLEMMVALAIRCEEDVMDDPRFGNRTDQWFWGMVNSLGLGSMRDDRYDRIFVRDTIDRFLDRNYEPNGKGGLFTVKHCDLDLRRFEIWYQLNCYLDSII